MEWNTLLSDNRIGGSLKSSYLDRKYPRSEFEKDYRRIVSMASFRRLQDKTQVFPLDKSDFVRTRLTHSIETSSLAKELGEIAIGIIKKQYHNQEEIPRGIDNIPDILMCTGLLHDIGNPPFGHFGEVVIGNWFNDNLKRYKFRGNDLTNPHVLNLQMQSDLYHFEGNAQAFRLLTKLHFLDNDCGMNLTDAILNTLIKYPNTSLNIHSKDDDIKLHKMGYFYADTNVFEEITKRTGTFNDNSHANRHPLTYLLEAADDIAYSTADLEDGFKKGMFTLEELSNFLNERFDDYCKDELLDAHQRKYTKELFDYLMELKKAPTKDTNITKSIKDVNLYALQNWVIYVQDWFIYCASFGFQNNYNEIMAGTYQKDLLYGTNHQYSMEILREAMKKFIFPEKSIVKLELAAKTIISSLLEKLVPALIYFDCPNNENEHEYCLSKADEKLIGLLSENYLQNYHKEAQKAKSEEEKLYLRLLLITDFICGMTDSYAKNLYQELNGIY